MYHWYLLKKKCMVSSGHQPKCRMECFTTEVGPQNSQALIVTNLIFYYMYQFLWSWHTKNDIMTSCLRFVNVKVCFNTNYLSHLALLYKMIASKATYVLMCIKVLFLKTNFLVYTTQKFQPSLKFMFQCIIFLPIKVVFYHIIFCMN